MGGEVVQGAVHVERDGGVAFELVRHDDQVRAEALRARDAHARAAPQRARGVVAARELTVARGGPGHGDGEALEAPVGRGSRPRRSAGSMSTQHEPLGAPRGGAGAAAAAGPPPETPRTAGATFRCNVAATRRKNVGMNPSGSSCVVRCFMSSRGSFARKASATRDAASGGAARIARCASRAASRAAAARFAASGADICASPNDDSARATTCGGTTTDLGGEVGVGRRCCFLVKASCSITLSSSPSHIPHSSSLLNSCFVAWAL